MAKVAVVVGTRPEAIKMAPVYRALGRASGLEPVLFSTGQHREMLAEALGAFELRPQVDLEVMQPGQSLESLTARVLERAAAAFREHKYDAVLVHGDTTTALAAALAAFYCEIPVGHVEAGLRSGRMDQPFPEEANRVLIDQLATWHYAPTEGAAAALRASGLAPDRRENILVTGNTVVDALLETVERNRQAPPADSAMEALKANRRSPDAPLVLVTCHRRESFGLGIERICDALARLATERPHIEIALPVHLNPRVRGPITERLGPLSNVHLLSPLGYRPFAELMASARLILTDSGGIQEEAPALGVPVLVMRDVTERPEAVHAGTAKLVGTETDAVVTAALQLLDNPDAHAAMAGATNPFGDGRASERIAEHLSKHFASQER